MKLFLSYKFSDGLFVHRVNYHLRRQPDIESFCYTGECPDASWHSLILHKVEASDIFVLFCGQELFYKERREASQALGHTQVAEAMRFYESSGASVSNLVVVQLGESRVNQEACDLPEKIHAYLRDNPRRVAVQQPMISINPASDPNHSVASPNDQEAETCAREILLKLGRGSDKWIEDDGLPIGYPFDYEKDIIDEFANNGLLLSCKRLEQGCPVRWPELKPFLLRPEGVPNPIPEEEIGTYRPHSAQIIVDVRSGYHGNRGEQKCLFKTGLTFREAGPREKLRYDPADSLRIAIVVSGGIAPGINAVIEGIVQRHTLYHDWARKKKAGVDKRSDPPTLDIVMYRDGFQGILDGRKMKGTLDELKRMATDVGDDGGSLPGTSRYDELLGDATARKGKLENIVSLLCTEGEGRRGVDILYVIGGDGTMRAAHAIHKTAKRMGKSISVVAIPKTMDNDILWVWQSFGFLTAVERAKQIIMQLQTEVKSNPRLCVIQLFGSDSGFVVSHAALASASCIGALIPEAGFEMKKLSEHICDQLQRRYKDSGCQRAFGTLLLAETAIPLDAENYLDDPAVGLEENEKEEIRRFLGSPLLNVSEISQWKEFCTALQETVSGHYAATLNHIRQRLPREVLAIIDAVARGVDSQWDDEALKASVVKALNQRIIRGALLCDRNSSSSDNLLPADARLLRHLMEAIDKATTPSQLEGVFFVMHGVQLPREAFVMQNTHDALKSKVMRLQTNLLSVSTDDTRKAKLEKQLADTRQAQEVHDKYVRTRLHQVMDECLNRILLETVLAGCVRKWKLCPGDGRVHGQTRDELRTGGLKIVARVLERDIRNVPVGTPSVAGYKEYAKKFRVFTNEPRHLLRAIPPSVSDVVFGQRLGVLAVDNAMAGYTDFLVSQWLTEYVLIPMELVVLGRKRVPPEGIFWKSVLAKAGTAQMFR